MTPQADEPLSGHCTLGVGGPARWFWRATDAASAAAALTWARDRSIPVHVLGGGSNVVIADGGVEGLVLAIDIRGLTFAPTDSGTVVTAGAGEGWDPLVAATVERGLAGLECLSGIPGLVGGTPVQNVGAYGQDVSATLSRVDAIDRRTLTPLSLSNADCAFGYRTSRFKRDDRDRFVVTAVQFTLKVGRPTLSYADVVAHFERSGNPEPSLQQVRDAILNIRRRKGMVIEAGNIANRSVGSFFVNPVIARRHFDRLARTHGDIPHFAAGDDKVKVPAAWLIERAGFPKGTRRGAVGVSPLQAQAIVAADGATAHDVLALASAIKSAVRQSFGIALVPEPIFVGFAPSAALDDLFDSESSVE
jgi:UDP-N-acetylmuramate dehydrogenase